MTPRTKGLRRSNVEGEVCLIPKILLELRKNINFTSEPLTFVLRSLVT